MDAWCAPVLVCEWVGGVVGGGERCADLVAEVPCLWVPQPVSIAVLDYTLVTHVLKRENSPMVTRDKHLSFIIADDGHYCLV